MSNPSLSAAYRRKAALYRAFSWWPFAVWLALALFAVWGYLNTQEEERFVGRVVSEGLVVAPLEDARIHELNLTVGQRVSEGELLATLDPSVIDSEIEALSIEIRQEHRERERRYVEARHRLLQRRQELELARKEDLARQKVLERENESLEKLNEQRLVRQGVYFDTLEEVEALRSSLEAYPVFLEEIEEELSKLEESVEIWNIGDRDELIDSDERIRFLREKREAMNLRAASDSIVSEILAQPGEVVMAGEPIFRLSLEGGSRIVGFVPESDRMYPNVGDILYVSSLSTRGEWLRAQVTALAPEVVMVPDQVSPLPGRMISGRYCYLELESRLEMVGGESVFIAVKPPGAWSFLKGLKDVDELSSISEAKPPMAINAEGGVDSLNP